MMNWSEWENEQEPNRATISPYWALVAIVLGAALAMALWSGGVRADPLFSATAEGATITLTNEPCKVPAISNLPFRAVWVEKDKTYEGCFGVRADLGLVLAYFDDRSVALIPVQIFRKVVGA